MKFLASIVASLAVAEAVTLPKDVLNAADHKMLMEKAIRVDKNMVPRHLEDGFQLSSAMSIVFNSCVSLTTEPSAEAQEVLFNNKYYSYAINGNFVSEKSYVLFNACETNYCDYAADDYNLFMVDLYTYLHALLPYYGTRKKNYCYACSESKYQCYQKWYQEDLEEEGKYSGGSSSSGNSYPNYNPNGGGYDSEYNPYSNQGNQQQQNNGYNGYSGYNGYNGYGSQQQQQAQQQTQQYQQAGYDGYDGVGEDNQTDNDGGDRRLYNNYNNQYYKNGNGYQNNGYGYNAQNQDYYQVVDCDTCKSMGCFDDDMQNNNGEQYYSGNQNQYYQGDDEIDVGVLSQWAMNIHKCKETGSYWADLSLYAGYMCNAKGNGVEIGLFLDDECSLYTTIQGFKDVASQQDQLYLHGAQSVVTYPFLHPVDCSDKLSYAPVGTSKTQDMNNYASYPCQQLFQGNSIMLDDCETNNNYGGEEDYYAANQNKYANGNYNGNGNANGNANYNSAKYGWYKYVLSQNDAKNPMGACKIIREMESEYRPLYRSDKSGETFDYGNTHARYKPVAQSGNGFFDFGEWEAAAVAGLIFVGALALGVLIWVWNSCCLEGPQMLLSTNDSDEKGERFIVLEDGDGKVIL